MQAMLPVSNRHRRFCLMIESLVIAGILLVVVTTNLSAATRPKPKNKILPKFISSEIIVKFTEDFGDAFDNARRNRNEDEFLRSKLANLAGVRRGRIKPAFTIKTLPGENRKEAFRRRTEKMKRKFSRRRSNTAGIPDLSAIYHLRVRPDTDIEQFCNELQTDPAVEWAEPHYYRYTQDTTPNDPNYGDQWHLPVIGAPRAWDDTVGSRDVVIAVIDTGVDWGHPDLSANIWQNVDESEDGTDTDGNGFVDDIRGWDFVDVPAGEGYEGEDSNEPDNDPNDFHGHGTHVSGIIGAVGNNNLGVSGVCWDVQIMPLRAGYTNSDGYGVLESQAIADALSYAADNGAHIVNMSFGGTDISEVEREAIDYCVAAGVVLIAASGNSSTDEPHFPARLDGVLSVAAITNLKLRADFSNYGIWIDIAAPGHSINSTTIGGGYGMMSGTSMACPVVAGVAGLIKAKNPGWDADQIKLQLKVSASALNLYNPDFVNLLGAGQVRADTALTVSQGLVKFGVVSLWPQEMSVVPDGLLGAGELVELRPSVKNFGSFQQAISVSLDTQDPYVTVLDGSSIVGDVNTGYIETEWDDPFLIYIEPNIPEDHTALLELRIFMNGSTPVGIDEMRLNLNPMLGPPLVVEGHSGEVYYGKPQLLYEPQDDRITVLYQSYGSENEVYVKAGIPPNITEFVHISDDPTLNSCRNYRTAIGSDGKIHVIFYATFELFDGELFYVQYDPNTNNWTSPYQLTTDASFHDSFDIFGMEQVKSAIAVDPDGNPHVVWVDFRNNDEAEFYHISHNGTIWSSEDMITTPPNEPSMPKLEFDTDGTGYLFWPQLQEASIYMTKMEEGVWGIPSPVLATDYPDLCVAVDSQDVVHLTYHHPTGSEISYSNLYQQVWSTPETVMSGTNIFYAPFDLAVGPGDLLHFVRAANPDYITGGATQLHYMCKDESGWSENRAVTFERTGITSSSPTLTLDSDGEIYIAVADDAEPHIWFHGIDIILMTSNHDPTWQAEQPVVTDNGDITSPYQIQVSWSSSHDSGIEEYEYSVGTAPGQIDIQPWLWAATSTNVTIDLSQTPMQPNQKYYVNVRALNGLGYWSAVGTSDGIKFVYAIQNTATSTWHSTIQEAIDDANEGDEIVLAPYTYTGDGNRDLNFGGKAITVRSIDPNDPDIVASTIIDCQGTAQEPHHGFLFKNGEESNSVVAGLTIINGYAADSSSYGGAIYCSNSGPTIRNCIMTGNTADSDGGGIGAFCFSQAPIIKNCVISQNSARNGGGIFCSWGEPEISNCMIFKNTAAERGGGIDCIATSALIENCTLTDNTADYGGGVMLNGAGSPTLSNCILWNNMAVSDGNEISLAYPSDSNVTITYCDVQDGPNGISIEQGWNLDWDVGNIDLDPLFVDPYTENINDRDYHLLPSSP